MRKGSRVEKNVFSLCKVDCVPQTYLKVCEKWNARVDRRPSDQVVIVCVLRVLVRQVHHQVDFTFLDQPRHGCGKQTWMKMLHIFILKYNKHFG